MTPEGKVKRRLREKLKELPKRYVFMPVQSGLGASTLDYLCCINGHFVGIETKKPNGKLPPKMTPRQEIVAAEIEAAGGIVFLVDSDASIDFVMMRLRELDADHRKPSK